MDGLTSIRNTSASWRTIGQLEQLIGAGSQAGMEIQSEPRQHGKCPGTGGIIWQAIHHGLRYDHGPSARTHDHAKAVLTHRDTPGAPIQDPQSAPASARQVKEQA
jgi:hypothetical protein